MTRSLAIVLTMITLAACEGGPVGGGFSTIPQSDTCDARSQRGLVGRTVTDRASLALAAPKVRLIDPGDAVTQDVQEDRLNIVFDEAGVVTRVYCG